MTSTMCRTAALVLAVLKTVGLAAASVLPPLLTLPDIPETGDMPP